MLRSLFLPALSLSIGPALSLSIGLALTVLPVLAADQATRDQIADLFRNRQWAEAQALLEKFTTTEPANAEAWNSLGQTFLARNDYEKAIPSFEKATQLDPQNSNYFLQLGHAYGFGASRAGLLAKLGFARKCKAAYEKAVALDPANLNARWSLMEFCRQAPGLIGGGMDQAYAQAAEIKRLDVRRGRAAYAALYTHEKKYADAFGVYDEVLRDHPADADALFHVGRLAVQTGEQLDRGLAALRVLITLEGRGQDARAHTFIGQILEKKGDKAGARTAYEAALAGDPAYTRAQEALRKLQEG